MLHLPTGWSTAGGGGPLPWLRGPLRGLVLSVLGLVAALAFVVSAVGLADPYGGGRGRPKLPAVATDLAARDPRATPNARAVYRMLAGEENAARAGRASRTVLGQHVEAQNERYNPEYGDAAKGDRRPGHYYRRAAELSGGRLPGFVETDLGPGYGDTGWGAGGGRWYDAAWPSCRDHWGYTDDATDLLMAVWKGYPRKPDGSYASGPAAADPTCPGAPAAAPAADRSDFANGGRPAGLVGMSFHEPYPGAPVKSYATTHCTDSPARTDPSWMGRVVDWRGNTPEYRALLTDLRYLADHLQYYAAYDVPVLLRPYHEMNQPGCHAFWWSSATPAQYRELWTIMYDYLVGTRGLHNLIFVWSPIAWGSGHAVDPRPYYPGSRYVDLVAVDDYLETPGRPLDGAPYTSVQYDALGRYRKPRMLAESFHLPVTSAVAALDRSPWVLWSVWGQALSEDNSPAEVRDSYRDPAVLTGGEGAAWPEALHRDSPARTAVDPPGSGAGH
ncbi:hypothetical protein BIV57_15480 [Mangrovactinospora gilvigrisea]|uniref:GH26 domain-containing protein n=2 Tax=Mangrovactinospora gilvigrisea TaxID=1428644 RepID=A0A1J7C4S0_9ACTN|nr:hypothetical protein BIV57_15480 [Mangrovactinospora gilvigrisea]